MTVLEVGPGNGRYTIETAWRVGMAGKVITVDIEPKMVQRVMRRGSRLRGLPILKPGSRMFIACPSRMAHSMRST